MNFNRGVIKNGKYVKFIDSNKAVLWKTRELSISPEIWDWIDNGNVTLLEFIDTKKKKRWLFDWIIIKDFAHLERVGQEKQYYFPLGIGREEYDGKRLDGGRNYVS